VPPPTLCAVRTLSPLFFLSSFSPLCGTAIVVSTSHPSRIHTLSHQNFCLPVRARSSLALPRSAAQLHPWASARKVVSREDGQIFAYGLTILVLLPLDENDKPI
jgi:hypothetical protein